MDGKAPGTTTRQDIAALRDAERDTKSKQTVALHILQRWGPYLQSLAEKQAQVCDADLKDILQQLGVLILSKKASQLADISDHYIAWLCTAAKLIALSQNRKKVSGTRQAQTHALQLCSNEVARIAQAERNELIEVSIQELEAELRSDTTLFHVFRLYFRDKILKPREILARLGNTLKKTTPGAVRVMIFRLRQRLRVILSKKGFTCDE